MVDTSYIFLSYYKSKINSKINTNNIAHDKNKKTKKLNRTDNEIINASCQQLNLVYVNINSISLIGLS